MGLLLSIKIIIVISIVSVVIVIILITIIIIVHCGFESLLPFKLCSLFCLIF